MGNPHEASHLGRLLATVTGPEPVLIRVNGWDIPTFCADTARVVGEAKRVRVTMLDRRGVAVAGFVPHG